MSDRTHALREGRDDGGHFGRAIGRAERAEAFEVLRADGEDSARVTELAEQLEGALEVRERVSRTGLSDEDARERELDGGRGPSVSPSRA